MRLISGKAVQPFDPKPQLAGVLHGLCAGLRPRTLIDRRSPARWASAVKETFGRTCGKVRRPCHSAFRPRQSLRRSNRVND